MTNIVLQPLVFRQQNRDNSYNPDMSSSRDGGLLFIKLKILRIFHLSIHGRTSLFFHCIII